jgi:hypothetical protein
MVTIDAAPAEGQVCLGMTSAKPIDGSTAIDGTSCSFMILSPTASPTLCLECLGFGEPKLKIRERGEFRQHHYKSAIENTCKIEEKHLPGCFILITTRGGASLALSRGGPWFL